MSKVADVSTSLRLKKLRFNSPFLTLDDEFQIPTHTHSDVRHWLAVGQQPH